MSYDTIFWMQKVFQHLLSCCEHFHVFFSYFYADTDISDSKVFFETVLKEKTMYKCCRTEAQNIFVKLLDFTDPYDGKLFYAPDDNQTNFNYKMVYPCSTIDVFNRLPCVNGAINIHNIVFQVERDSGMEDNKNE